jgi:hypothetical protein
MTKVLSCSLINPFSHEENQNDVICKKMDGTGNHVKWEEPDISRFHSFVETPPKVMMK